MDLAFNEEQTALRGLVRQIFEGHCTDERIREIEAGPDRFDARLWEELARANVLGAGLAERLGGIGGGMLEVCIVLEEAGRVTAPVPLWASMTGALACARFGVDEAVRSFIGGGAPLVVGLMEPDGADPFEVTADARSLRDGWYVDGAKTLVPAAERAAGIVLTARARDGLGLFLLDPHDAVAIERQEPTGTEPTFEVELAGTKVSVLAEPPADDAVAWLRRRALVAACAEQVGVAEHALLMTAAYTSQREQFGKPLGAFQAVQQRAADAYIDVEAMRWTMLEAAWRLDAGLDAGEHVEVAKVWAADGGARVLAAAQHLHGGIGVDLDYPLHRYTFAARQLELRLGGAGAHLQRLGDMIAS